MKGVQVYHAIRVLRENGKSIREIAEQLSVSKTTVISYLQKDIDNVENTLSKVKRTSKLEVYREEITQKLTRFPTMRLSKLYRKLTKQHGKLPVNQRAFFDFSKKIKDNLIQPTKRYYRVVNYEPGNQMQVDPGEYNICLSDRGKLKIYFCVFSYCYSRMKYVHFQTRPYKTQDFIQAHKDCFEYFGYIPETMVYDQTKLVVIREIYREVTYNNKFFHFMNSLAISPYACEGYDPESKGLVERQVQEVKYDFLDGEVFTNLSELKLRSKSWLEEVNNRIHSTLRERPIVMFKEEEKLLRTYNLHIEETRKVDKTGLISWNGNKYSVPYIYQQKIVIVRENEDTLEIIDKNSRQKVASHRITRERTKPIISQCHYIDYSKTINNIKEDICSLFPNNDKIILLLNLLIAHNHRNPREQLLALLKMYNKNKCLNWSNIISKTLELEDLKATKIESIVKEEIKTNKLSSNYQNQLNEVIERRNSAIQRDLTIYNKVIKK